MWNTRETTVRSSLIKHIFCCNVPSWADDTKMFYVVAFYHEFLQRVHFFRCNRRRSIRHVLRAIFSNAGKYMLVSSQDVVGDPRENVRGTLRWAGHPKWSKPCFLWWDRQSIHNTYLIICSKLSVFLMNCRHCTSELLWTGRSVPPSHTSDWLTKNIQNDGIRRIRFIFTHLLTSNFHSTHNRSVSLDIKKSFIRCITLQHQITLKIAF